MHRVLLVTLVTLATPAPARAAPPERERARRDFAEGKRHFRAKRYRQAIRAFERAYRHRPHRVIRYNIALAYARWGKPRLAAEHLRRYLARARRTDPPLPEELRAVLAPPRARLGEAPLPPPGTRALGRPRARLAPVGRKKLSWAWFAGTAGVAVTSLVASIATSARTAVLHDRFLDDPTNTALRASGIRHQEAAKALWAITAVTTASAAVLALFTRWRRPERARRITAAPTLGPGAAGVHVTLRY